MMKSWAWAWRAAATISSFGRAGPAQLDVPADGVVEQDGFLRDNSDLVAEVARGNVTNVHAADTNGAALRVIKTQQQIGERRFAGATGADEGNQLAGLDSRLMSCSTVFSP